MNYARRSNTSSRFDSFWMLMHKFAYLNGASHGAIRELFELPERNLVKATNLIDFFRWDSQKLAEVFERTEKELEFAIPAIYGIGGALAISETLRYCPVCIQKGFHTAAFQVNAIKLCPLHGVKLEQHCPACNQLIPYKIRKRELSVPFGCSCGYNLWPDLYSMNWPQPLEQGQDKIFEQLITWVSKFKTLSTWTGNGELMPGLSCLEPIVGWEPKYFGAVSGGIVEWSYEKKSIERNKQNAQPLNLKEFDVKFPNHHIREWIQHMLLPFFKDQIQRVTSEVKNVIGSHIACADDMVVNNEIIGTIGKGFCLWGAAYASWKSDLQSKGWLDVEGQGYFLVDWIVLNSYKRALSVIDGSDADPRQMSNPQLLWLMTRIFHAELLCDFGLHLAKVCEAYSHVQTIDKMLVDILPKQVEPVYAYYPGNRKISPTLRVYIGYSLIQLRSFTKRGEACMNSVGCCG